VDLTAMHAPTRDETTHGRATAAHPGETGRLRTGRGILSLCTGLFAGPLLALSSQLALYAATPVACQTGNTVALHLLGAVTVLLALAAGGLAWTHWRRTGRDWPGEEGGVAGRSRFLAALGTASSAFFALVVLAMWAPVFVMSPCQGG
jgi:hypothetical protein